MNSGLRRCRRDLPLNCLLVPLIALYLRLSDLTVRRGRFPQKGTARLTFG